jgi:asparagine synthase (glutamine-hydrolysing)
VTVALNGDGGDESFGGYTRYVSNAMAARFERLPRLLRRRVSALGARVPRSGEITSVRNKARRFASGLGLDAPDRYLRYISRFDAGQRALMYAPEFAAGLGAGPDAVIARAWATASGADVIDQMLEVDASTYLVDDLIAKIDIATMAHALEARSPLLDHQLMELAATIPADLKVRGQQKKWILRETLRGWLPDDLLDRPKQGFSVPLSSWLRTDLRAWARDILLDREAIERGYFRPGAVEAMLDRHAAGTDDDARRIWALVMLELWHKEFTGVPALRPTILAA